MELLLIYLVIGGGMYLVFVLPGKKLKAAHRELVASAKAGDRVLMASGVYGTITEMLDTTMYVEIAEGIEILVARSQVSDIVEEFPTDRTDDTDDEDADSDDEDVDETIEEEA